MLEHNYIKLSLIQSVCDACFEEVLNHNKYLQLRARLQGQLWRLMFPFSENILLQSVCLSVYLLEPEPEVYRLMLLGRQEKGVTRATGWFCWQCWAWEKGKLYLMGWGWSRKQGFGSLLWGGLTFCSGTELLQPEPSICRALAKLHYWPNLKIELFMAACKHTQTDTLKQTKTVDRATQKEGGKRQRAQETVRDKKQQSAQSESNQLTSLSSHIFIHQQ